MKSLTRKLLHVSISALALCASLFMMTPPARAASPEAGAARPASSDYVCVYHTVKRGDTLTRIANHYRVTIQAIQRANGLRGTGIYIGQRLCIPRPKPVPQPTPSPGPWYAEFWNNTEQSGVPAVVRTVAAINFDWGFGSPDPARVFADNFSTRFVRTATLQGGVYRFTFRVDDGLRVWIDNNVVYDQYGFVGQLNGQFDVEVLPGVHTIRVDYVERTGKASVTLTYARLGGPLPEPTPPSNNGPWYTEFFANMELKGPPVAVRTYGGLKFDWRGSSPVAGVPAAYWSARFSQFRYLGAGVYRFVVNSDDGVRVYVNDQLVIDRWGEQSARTWIGDIRLNAGTHSIRVEYLQVAGTSLIELYWQFLGG